MPASNVQQELWWSSTKVLHAGALTYDVIAGMHLHDTQYPLAYSWRFHLATPYDCWVSTASYMIKRLDNQQQRVCTPGVPGTHVSTCVTAFCRLQNAWWWAS